MLPNKAVPLNTGDCTIRVYLIQWLKHYYSSLKCAIWYPYWDNLKVVSIRHKNDTKCHQTFIMHACKV